ncbi:hypothetical protein NE237_025692 [Protea cynaroides]|uniref:Uncharacterized protein n=1 Tax=Protea cynaroides TaxID=273540 RepID=A0A9Q0H2E8_9MAGN|nr:hypothetical protein NE237_025692 [Protea cynaroides]
MGTAISRAANGIGGIIGSALLAPFKSIFGGSCEGICAGTWDITCFIEHLCISNLVRLLVILGLIYISLMFIYLLFQVGIIQCIGRSLCKMGWAACETYWFALEDISCFMWHKLKNTKRVYRGRRRRRHRHFADVEEGYSSTDDNEPTNNYESLSVSRKRSVRERRKDRMQMYLYPVKHRSKYRHMNRSHRHNVLLKTSELSVHVKSGSGRLRNSRQLQLRKAGNLGRGANLFKKRRISCDAVQRNSSSGLVTWCKICETNGDPLEAEILDFMEQSDNLIIFSTRKELIDAGRMDLVEAIAQRGDWFALGWDLEEEDDDDDEKVQEDEFQHSIPSTKEVDDSSVLRDTKSLEQRFVGNSQSPSVKGVQVGTCDVLPSYAFPSYPNSASGGSS